MAGDLKNYIQYKETNRYSNKPYSYKDRSIVWFDIMWFFMGVGMLRQTIINEVWSTML